MTDFETRCRAMVNDLGLLFAHQPDEPVQQSLEKMSSNLNAEYGRIFPDANRRDIARAVDELIAQIQIRRREIEAAGLPSRGRT